VSLGSSTTYGCDGDSDRVSQTVDSVETTYILDVATPLTGEVRVIQISRHSFLLLTGLLLVSCMKEYCPPVSMNATNSEHLQFIERILAAEDEACAPPCWQGLIPGAATQTDVLAVLRETSFVNKDSITYEEPSANMAGVINWSNTGPQSLSVPAQATFNDDKLLTSIRFSGDLEHPLESLGTIVETFGEPDYYSVASSHDFSCKWSRLIWLDAGLEIHTYAEESEENGPRLTEDTAVSSIGYFIPQETLEGYLLTIAGVPQNQLQEHLLGYQEWNGFNERVNSANE
jgi:hypothetical protein